jgi:cytoskeletal protein RodZ
MKTVGKQLQEARLAKNWTPELAARETKIQIARLKDLESDDYSHFNSATYARGFVRTYARALGLDEYKILRQLDNKLPDDDSANIVSTEGGVAYVPGTGLPPRAAHRDYTGLYVVMTLGAVVTLAIVFVLFEAYRVGELSRWMGSDTAASEPASTNVTPANPANPGADATARALPIDSNTPPPISEPTPTNAVTATPPADTNAPTDVPPRAQSVDLTALNSPPAPTPTPTPAPSEASTPPPADIPTNAPRAMPVNPADLNNAPPPADIPAKSSTPAPGKVPPRALPVDPADLASDAANTGEPTNPPPAPVVPTTKTPANDPERPTNASIPAEPPATHSGASNADSSKPLVLTASRDSFVRVTALDTAGGDKAIYAAVLHSGQSIGFNGHKFSVNVDNPSAVDIKLDGVNYGPHSDNSAPETFTVISHVQ